MSHLLGDFRHGFRLLISKPGLALVSILTLALGIGLTTMMFSIVHGALLRGLPFADADRLVTVERNNVARGFDRMWAPQHDFLAWKEQQRAFEALAGHYTGTVNVRGTERAERFDGGFVTDDLFQVLGEPAALGRTLQPGDGRPGADPVVLLSHSLWRDLFAGDPGVVGRTITANGVERTVVGVMREGFHYPVRQQLWLPHTLAPDLVPRGQGQQLQVVGRLRPAVSIDEASVEMAGIARRLALEYPGSNDGYGAVVRPFLDTYIPDEPRALLFTMLGAVFFVLLIACVNVANLLLGRAALRMKEVGVRSALGATRGRLVLQFLAEPLALALVGAVVGVGLAWLGIRGFVGAIASTNPPYFLRFGIDGPILLFVVALTLLVTVLSGLLPALRASGTGLSEVLKDETRGSSSFRMGRLTRGLVIFEIALSCALLIGAGLMIRSVTNLGSIDYGFDPDLIFTARVGVPEAQMPDTAEYARFFATLDGALREEPSMRAVALAEALPGLFASMSYVWMEGVAYAQEHDRPRVRHAVITPGYFDVLGTRPVQGRDFGSEDTAESLPVAIVNETFERLHFPSGNALGARIRMGGERSEQPWRTIVGVVPDLRMGGPENEDPQGVYTPLAQNPRRFMSVLALAQGDQPLSLTAPVRDAVTRTSPDVPIYFVETLGSSIRNETWFYRVFGGLFMIMGFAALFLASIGLYGVMSFSVGRRTRELGVRMALGAQPAGVSRMIMRQGMGQLALGLAVGLLLALALSQLLAGVLFDVRPRDPVTFGSIVLVLTVVGAMASYLPAFRATRVDPIVALRVE